MILIKGVFIGAAICGVVLGAIAAVRWIWAFGWSWAMGYIGDHAR